MKHIRAILWDMDGTLLNTLDDLHDSVNVILSQYGLPPQTRDDTRRFLGNGLRSLMTLSVPDGERHPQFEAILSDFSAYYAAHCRLKTRPYDGIPALLDALKAQGYRMAVVSNKIDAAVKELAALHFPALDYALGETPGLARKPAPDMIRAAMQALQVTPEETLYIGDSEVDLATAHGAGLPCISVLWGFRSREELLAHGARCLAETPADIPVCLTSWEEFL